MFAHCCGLRACSVHESQLHNPCSSMQCLQSMQTDQPNHSLSCCRTHPHPHLPAQLRAVSSMPQQAATSSAATNTAGKEHAPSDVKQKQSKKAKPSTLSDARGLNRGSQSTPQLGKAPTARGSGAPMQEVHQHFSSHPSSSDGRPCSPSSLSPQHMGLRAQQAQRPRTASNMGRDSPVVSSTLRTACSPCAPQCTTGHAPTAAHAKLHMLPSSMYPSMYPGTSETSMPPAVHV